MKTSAKHQRKIISDFIENINSYYGSRRICSIFDGIHNGQRIYTLYDFFIDAPIVSGDFIEISSFLGGFYYCLISNND